MSALTNYGSPTRNWTSYTAAAAPFVGPLAGRVAMSGVNAREGRELARFLLQQCLGPDNMFDPAAANRFMTSLDAAFGPHLQNPPTQSRYDMIRPQMNSLAEHARLTTQQLKSEFAPIDQRFVREALWRGYQAALSAVGQPGKFDYSKITAHSIYDQAKTLQTIDDIHQSYRTMTTTGIAGTSKLYQKPFNCPDGGLINWGIWICLRSLHLAAISKNGQSRNGGSPRAWGERSSLSATPEVCSTNFLMARWSGCVQTDTRWTA
jgi:hypothetical protein